MLRLLSKEMKLFFAKPALLFLILPSLMLVPAYPAIAVVFFSFFIVQICYTGAQSNRDIEFTAMLPVSRKQIVMSKILVTVVIQLTYLAICIPFALISSLILSPGGNVAGMDKNIAFFGYALFTLGIFDLIFFPLYFKNTHKLGMPIFAAVIGFFIFPAIFEIIVGIVPQINAVLDTLNPEMIWAQAIFSACCVVAFIGVIFGAYKLSCKAFEKMVI